MTPERFARLSEVLDRRQPDLTVLMEQVNKAHNFSAILRSCDSVGALEAHAVPPEGGLPTFTGTSAGSDRWVEVHDHPDVDAAVRALHERGFRVVAAHPDDDAPDFRTLDYTHPTAFMVGAELHGIGDRGLELADTVVRIPMVGMVPSFNVSVATALLLFEAFRQRDREGMYDRCRLEPERRRTILFEWAYPRLARLFRAKGRAYPDLDETGGILLSS